MVGAFLKEAGFRLAYTEYTSASTGPVPFARQVDPETNKEDKGEDLPEEGAEKITAFLVIGRSIEVLFLALLLEKGAEAFT